MRRRLGAAVWSAVALLGCEAPHHAVRFDGGRGVQVEVSSSVGVVREVPAGRFTMGCVPGRDDHGVSCDPPEPGWVSQETPAHPVTLTRPLWAMVSELTQAQWEGLGLANPSTFRGAHRPVETVSWWEALAVANLASTVDGLAPCYRLQGCTDVAVGEGRVCEGVAITSPSGSPYGCEGWRLPTEAEWEYLARGGEEHAYAGADDVAAVGWEYRGSVGWRGVPRTQRVCHKARNGFGLCDFSGNVWEWVWDLAGAYPDGPQVDPVGPDRGAGRVYRGGRAGNVARFARASSRNHIAGGARDRGVGFRLVRTAP